MFGVRTTRFDGDLRISVSRPDEIALFIGLTAPFPGDFFIIRLFAGLGERRLPFECRLPCSRTGTFTLGIPKGVLVPDVEADDAADL